jgi:hypothetical protein
LEELGVDGRISLKKDVQHISWEGEDWIDLARDAYSRQTAVKGTNETLGGFIKYREFLD